MKMELKRPWSWMLAGMLIAVMAVVAIPGFDPKTTMAILVPTSFCTMLIGYQLFKQSSRELIGYFGVFLVFTIIVLINLSTFHDILFYYVITGILCFLFVQQALKLNREQKQRKAEQAQIARLQFKLEQNHQKNEPQKIRINSAGKIELIASEQIAFCKAAGDYVELYLGDNKQILFSGNLKELEKQLPNTFLRVHRSYLVNMEFIQSLSNKSTDLQKSPAGGGFLLLSGGFEVPVSRRIMPMVRSAIQ
jgi:DNA-binding LytR/AlgR family response regulator